MPFDRSAVQALLKVGEYESIVITELLNDGIAFGREDQIRVIRGFLDDWLRPFKPRFFEDF